MKKLYPLLFLIISLMSCKNDSFMGVGEESPSNVVSNYNFGSTTQRNFQGVVLDITGAPVYGATVQIGTTSVTTNYKGYFTFKNASVQENFAHVKVTKAGFVNASRVLVPTNGMNRVNIMMIPATLTSTVSSGATSTVSLADGTKVKFDGSFKDANGNAYTGSVSVSLYHLAPSNTFLNELMPGSFLATSSNGSARMMETFGMLHVQLTGSAGQNLQIATGHTAEITVPVDASQSSTSPSTIPLWSYNESTGMWNEEGSATKVGNTYVGTVSHFSWWNCDIQLPQATLKVTVKNNAGQPLPNIKVGLRRASQSYDVYGYSDNVGVISGIVPAGEILTMKVYDICDNVIYTASVGPFAIGSISVLPDVIVTPPASTSYIIQGNLKTCSNTDVTNGAIMIRNLGSSNLFNYLMVPVSNNGSFVVNTYACGTNPQFIYQGFDYDSITTTGEVTLTATTNNINLGNIFVCNSATEFVSYKIDSQQVVYLIGFTHAEWFGATTSPNTASNQLSIFAANGPAVPLFQMKQNNMMGVAASFTTDYTITLTSAYITPSNGNIVNNISTFGPVGNYIDFNLSGTYNDVAGMHTVSAVGHVKRSN